MSAKVLVSGGTILSLDRGIGNVRGADLLVEDGVVSEVGTSLRARNAEVVDAEDAIVMPGFVDTHRHVWHSLFRNVGPGTEPAAVGPQYSADDLYAATLIGLLGAVQAGITTVVDFADVPCEAAFFEAAIQAHADTGLRTILVACQPEWDSGASDPAKVLAAVGERHGPEQTLALGIRPGTSNDWDVASRRDLRLHVHLGARSASAGNVAKLRESSMLGPDVTLLHCMAVNDHDLDAIDSSGAKVSLSPASDMTDGLGWPPMQGLIDRGIRPGLGVGSEMESPGDMFAQMRAANAVQHATLFDLKLAGKGGIPNLLTTRDVIRYATVDGAGAVGLDDVTGSLRPGKQADFVVLRTDRPNIAPVNDPIGAVVWGMDTSNIDWVFVGGRALVRDGELTADVERARSLATNAQRHVAAATGLLAETAAERM